MTSEEIRDKAWKSLCSDMASGLHQYDYWEDVPFHVQSRYIGLEVAKWFCEEQKKTRQKQWEKESLEEYERSQSGHGNHNVEQGKSV